MMILAIRTALGALFLTVGLAGLVLPVLPGWIFLVFAMAMAFPRHRSAEWVVRRTESHAPRFGAFLRRLGIGQPTRVVARISDR